MIVEILDKKTDEVLEEKEVGQLSTWDFYWNMQCDTDRYYYRIKEM
jgi:hypothetical protein